MSAGEVEKGLVERLLKVEGAPAYAGEPTTCYHRNPDGPEAAARIAELEAQVAGLTEALEPSGATKAAYHGEFKFQTEDGVSGAGIERWRNVYVPWTTVKEIMAAIRDRAARSILKDNTNGQS